MKVGQKLRVGVIGAGPSGIAAAKNLLQAGIDDVVVFDGGDRVGGNWAYSAEPGHSPMYEVAHAITSRSLSQFHDYPLPADCAEYPAHEVLRAYFDNYAQHFGVLDHVRFNTIVAHAHRIEDDAWRLTVKRSDVEQVEEVDHLVVANGHHWNPRLPTYPGEFSGEFIHSHGYRHNRDYVGRRVLVIGGGNSAVDIVSDISRCAARAAISWRRGYYVVPKFFFGVPSDVIGRMLDFLPVPISKRVKKLLWRVIVGGNRRYGLPDPDHGFGERAPIISSEFLERLQHGDIQPKPEIAELNDRDVTFVDNTKEQFDVIIAATGYHVTFPFLPDSTIMSDQTGPRLFHGVFHPLHPTLHFVGLLQPQGCIWPLSDAQSQLIAKYILGDYRFPKDIEQRIDQEVYRTRRRFPAASTMEVDSREYLKKISRELRQPLSP